MKEAGYNAGGNKSGAGMGKGISRKPPLQRARVSFRPNAPDAPHYNKANEMKHDQREPVLKKVGVYFSKGGEKGFSFFEKDGDGCLPFDGDVFIYNQGILFRVLPNWERNER